MGTPKSPQRWQSRCLVALGASLVLLLAVLGVQGGTKRGAWMSKGFQALNLETRPLSFEAHFLAPDGTLAYVISDTLPAGEARYYEPATMDPPLPETFSGTLSLDSDGEIAMGVVHLDESNMVDGNTVFVGVADELLSDRALTPIDRCILLHVHNPNPTREITASLSIFDLSGIPAGGVKLFQIPPEGGRSIYPLSSHSLPLDFTGSGLLLAGHPVEVTVRNLCGGYAAFVAPSSGSMLLFAPAVAPEVPPLISSTLFVMNTSFTEISNVTVFYSSGDVDSAILDPAAGVFFHSPFTSTSGTAIIAANQPVVAFVQSDNRETNNRGVHEYPAFALAEATPAVALPVLFTGHEGWETGNRIWVKNVGALTTLVKIRYVTAPTGTLAWDQGVVAPGEVLRFPVPDLPGDLAAAILLSEAGQPIVALAGAFNSDLGNDVRDRHIRYRGTNFDFDCGAVAGTDFQWDPQPPTIGREITFDATAWSGGIGWLTATVDAGGLPGSDDVGANGSLALGWAGRPHISYVDQGAGLLKFAAFDGWEWQIEVVDSSGAVEGVSSLALDGTGQAHISYHGDGDLNYAFRNSEGWSIEVIDPLGDAGDYNSVAVDSTGRPHVSYYVNGDLRYAFRDHNAGWITEPVDEAGLVGHHNSLALDGDGRPHISYCDWNRSYLRYAYFDGSNWLTQTVDAGGTSGTDQVCEFSSLALDAAGWPHISYYDKSHRDLKYAWYDGSQWSITTVDGDPDRVGRYSSLALDAAGRPHISYYDETHHTLKYAWYDDNGWHFQTVDQGDPSGSEDVGQYSTLALTRNGYPRISYCATTQGDLRYAWFWGSLVTPPISYQWDLGDGTTAQGAIVSHRYGSPDRYTVTVTATNCLGFGTVTTTHAINIVLPSVYLPLVSKGHGP